MSNKHLHLHLKERRRMKLKTLTTAMILATVPMTGAFAAALDRSGQSISAFLQPGNYFEAGISVLDPDVSGKAISTAGGGNLSDMGDDYYFPSAALKLQVTDHFSFGLIYDQPFGADAAYSTSDPLVGLNTGLLHLNGEATEVEVDTQSLSMIFGFQPNENFNIYAGPVYQTIKGNVQLRGAAYGSANGLGLYNADLDEDGAVGWLAGFAYQIPEIALKTAVTYRSEIKHEIDTTETFGFGAIQRPNALTEIITPQSVNIDFQTGIAANTLAFANIRWVHWDQFAVTPKFLNAVSGNNLIDYSDDQWSATVGVGRKFNSHWSGSASVGYDSGVGNPVTTLGPTEGYWTVGLGGQYSPAENYFIQAGVKYFWLGDFLRNSKC